MSNLQLTREATEYAIEIINPSEKEKNQMDPVNQFLRSTRMVKESGFLYKRPRVVCKDNFSVSIQASSTNYCTPESDEEDVIFKTVELGYPSEEDDLILQFAEYKDDPTSTVYPQVPIEIVNELLEKRGGIVDQISPII